MNAWIVTWDGTDENIDRSQIVAAYNYRNTARTVQTLVEYLYIALIPYSDAERLKFAKSPKSNPYRAVSDRYGRIICGHNPWLNARFVRDIYFNDNAWKWTEPNIKKIVEAENKFIGRSAWVSSGDNPMSNLKLSKICVS